MHSESSQKIPRTTVKRICFEDKETKLYPKMFTKIRESIDRTQKTYFTGVHDTLNIRRILDENNTTRFRAISVYSLEIIDSQIGAIMEGVFTLVPREKGIRVTSKKRDNFGAFESLRQNGRFNNSRGNSRMPMSESPSKPPYITVVHYAQRAAIGTADSMKNITSKTHEEITRVSNVIEQLSLEHIPFDEVMGFWTAQKL
jgi:hypothetical protein